MASVRPTQPDGATLLRAVERLGVVGSVLYVAAHPDDENTRLLAYLSGERLLRTAYLSLTRGDGGQNLIGPQQGPQLGLIRTQELLAARAIDGAEQLFTRARDFGYSKSPRETLSIWDKDAVLADVVWVIRRFRPDVIITRFPTEGMETHGHHTSSAILAEEAYRLAADPAFHPEQVAQAGTWQARRLLWNRPNWDDLPPDAPALRGFLPLEIGGYNPVLGASYGEIAADSRSMHKSQGFGSERSRTSRLEYFKPLLGSAPTRDLFDGIDVTWGRVAGPGAARLAELLREAVRGFDVRRPEGSIPVLLQARAELQRLPADPVRERKLRELTEVIAWCAGLFVEATAAEDYSVVPGGELLVKAVALNRSRAQLALQEVRLPGAVIPGGQRLEARVRVPKDAAISQPFWLEEAPTLGLYAPGLRDLSLIGPPERPPALLAEFVVRAGDQTLVLPRPVVYKWTDPVLGERYRAVEIAPRVTVQPEGPVLMFPDGGPKTLRVQVKAGADEVAGVVRPEVPAGFAVTPVEAPFQIKKKGGEQEVRFLVKPPAAAAQVTGTLRVVALVGGERLSRGLVRIDYPHIPIQTLFPPAEVKLCRVDLVRTHSKLGYIAGAGDEVPAALRQVGYDVTMLDEAALSAGGLSRFGAIVIGVRAFNTNPRLPFYHQRLMDYVAAGGTLVVQYSTVERPRPGEAEVPIGPHPFQISRDRVTDENAVVKLAPHAVLQRPNRIGEADFQGWVQERGLYFASKIDAAYQTPLRMADPGEGELSGGLLVARHGKGGFIYTGLSFFRQLPAGVPGAYRLFANLISYLP